MKFMNWSWQDLMNAPDSVVDEIIEIMNEQALENNV